MIVVAAVGIVGRVCRRAALMAALTVDDGGGRAACRSPLVALPAVWMLALPLLLCAALMAVRNFLPCFYLRCPITDISRYAHFKK